MPLPLWIGSLIKPVAELIDSLHTSKEEKLQAQAALLTVQSSITEKVLDYESKLNDIRGKIILAEAQGQSSIQRNWRPLLALSFGFIVVWNYVVQPLGTWLSLLAGGPTFPILDLPGGFWALLTTMIGGYAVGRSVEKVLGKSTNAILKSDG